MLPYVPHPTLELGAYTLEAFWVLVGLAIVVEFQIVMRRAPRYGIERTTTSTLAAWAIGLGIVGAHVFDVLVYYPERLRANPLELFRIWGSLSSFGGMLGGNIAEQLEAGAWHHFEDGADSGVCQCVALAHEAGADQANTQSAENDGAQRAGQKPQGNITQEWKPPGIR